MAAFESLKLAKTARTLVERWARLRPEEDVCVVADTNKLKIAEAIAAACAAVGSETVICIMSPRPMPGMAPPGVVAAAMKVANVVFAPITYSFGHTEAFHAAINAGARIFMMREVTEESFTRGAASADFDDIDRINKRLIADLKDTKRIRMVSPLGSDLTMSVEGRPPVDLIARLRGGLTFPTGEVPFCPLEGTTNGVVVVDHAMGGVGRLTEPVRVGIKDGQIVKVEGGDDAKKFEKAIHGVENAANIAEFAIGTNPLSLMTGSVAEDKILRGSVHVGIGTSIFLGGKVKSGLHLDLIVLEPTVWCDDREVVTAGVLNPRYLD
ncbi:MAG: aminopeptidase [Chloroflexota bacterium]